MMLIILFSYMFVSLDSGEMDLNLNLNRGETYPCTVKIPLLVVLCSSDFGATIRWWGFKIHALSLHSVLQNEIAKYSLKRCEIISCKENLLVFADFTVMKWHGMPVL